MTLRTEAGDSPTSSMRRQVARPDRRAGFEVALDQPLEDVLAAGVEDREKVFGGFGHSSGMAVASMGFTI